MQRLTSPSATGNISLTTHWPTTAPAAAADDDTDDDVDALISAGDISQVKTPSAWTLSTGRHSGMLNFIILDEKTTLC